MNIPIKLNPHLKEFWISKKPIRVLWGGRSSSKTEEVAGGLIHLSSKYKIKVACVRKFQANIKQSVYSVIKKKVMRDNYFKPFFNFTDKNISTTIGSEFIFLGWERNTDQIKGLDDVDIMWIEEGHTLTKEQWQIIKDTVLLRKDNAIVIIVFNPYLDTDFVWTEFVVKEHSNVLTMGINYNKNIFLPKKALEIIQQAEKTMDEDDFNHTYLGYPKAENEMAFIKRKWIEACIDAHIKLGIEIIGAKYIGYDIADAGEDYCATTTRHGILTTEIEEWKAKEDELLESAKRVYDKADEINAEIIYDCIGVGASAGSVFKELNELRDRSVSYEKFDAGASVLRPHQEYQENRLNKDHFENLKAQMWQDVADRMLHTYNAVVKGKEFDEDMIISISSKCKHLDKLKIELSSPKKDKSKRGLVKVESKEDLKKRGIPSPNIADSFIMCYFQSEGNSFFS